MDRFGETETLVIAYATTHRTLFLLAEARLREAGINFYRHEEVTTFPTRRGNETTTSGLYQLIVRASVAEEAWALLKDMPETPPEREEEQPEDHAGSVSPAKKKQWGLLLFILGASLLGLLVLVAAAQMRDR